MTSHHPAIVLALVALMATPAAAQVGTEPAAWAPDHRGLADGISNALVVLQSGEAAIESARAWRDGDHRTAYVNACAAGVALLTSESLKRAVHEVRPDGSDALSWPSGHSTILAALAGNSPRRFGFGFSITIPIAVMGGVSRSWANKHHLVGGRLKVGDVTSGLAIGALERWACSALIR